ncbi:MAG: oligosaccharide flippase family protein [Chloracidobacterium sp.]|nr:oligosaccharide flippase family protein [Chloracidobacterium sp.]
MNQAINNQTSKSIFRNVVYGSLTWILPIGLGFVATPIIVRSLGNSDYGIYALVLGFISYSFTFNFGRAITKYIAEYRVTGESEKIRDVVSASFFLNIVIGLIGVFVMCLSAGWLVRTVFNIEPEAQHKTITAIYIASGIIFLWMLSQVFTSVLQGIQRFDVYSKIFTANSFVLTLGNLALAYFGYGLLSLLTWNIVVLSAFFIVFGYAARRLLPEFGITFKFNSETLKLVLRYSSAIVATQLLANLLLLFERGFITHRLGPESLTYYVVPMSLGLYLHGFVASLVQVVFPLASELKNEPEKLLRLYSKATKVICLLVVFVVVSVSVESSLFLRLWMGEAFAVNSASLLVLHITCFGLIAIVSVAWQMTEGLGRPQFNAIATAVCTTIGISLMILLSNGLGNFGVALARLIAFIVMFFSIFVVEKMFFKKMQFRFWLALTGNLALAAITAAAVEYSISSSLPSNWPSLILAIFVGGLVYCLILWLLNFVTEDDKLLVKRIFNS